MGFAPMYRGFADRCVSCFATWPESIYYPYFLEIFQYQIFFRISQIKTSAWRGGFNYD